MKSCPQCGKTYDDDNSFCFDDGTALVLAYQSFTPADVPTQVIPRAIPTETRSGASPWLYTLLGVLATAIIAMGSFMWLSRRDEPVATNQIASGTPATPTPDRGANAPSAGPAPAPQITNPAPPASIDSQQIRNDVMVRLTKWERDGEAKDGYAVASNYANSVTYYRRAGATPELIRQDKSRAYAKFDSIDITLSNISVTPSPDGNSARVVLDKAYFFGGSRTLQGKVQQEIRLVRVGSEWLINSERDLRVYYQTK
jgi:hypothetical protein